MSSSPRAVPSSSSSSSSSSSGGRRVRAPTPAAATPAWRTPAGGGKEAEECSVCRRRIAPGQRLVYLGVVMHRQCFRAAPALAPFPVRSATSAAAASATGGLDKSVSFATGAPPVRSDRGRGAPAGASSSRAVVAVLRPRTAPADLLPRRSATAPKPTGEELAAILLARPFARTDDAVMNLCRTLGKVPPLLGLSPFQQRECVKSVSAETVRAGFPILSGEAPPRHLYFVFSGAVQVESFEGDVLLRPGSAAAAAAAAATGTASGFGGADTGAGRGPVRVHGPGEPFGGPDSVRLRATALEKTVLCSVTNETFAQITSSEYEMLGDDGLSVLQKIPFLQTLPVALLKDLLRASQKRVLRTLDAVFEEDDRPTHIFLLTSGACRITKRLRFKDSHGAHVEKSLTVQVREQPAVFGVQEALRNAAYMGFGAAAISPAVLFVIPKAAFFGLLTNDAFTLLKQQIHDEQRREETPSDKEIIRRHRARMFQKRWEACKAGHIALVREDHFARRSAKKASIYATPVFFSDSHMP